MGDEGEAVGGVVAEGAKALPNLNGDARHQEGDSIVYVQAILYDLC